MPCALQNLELMFLCLKPSEKPPTASRLCPIPHNLTLAANSLVNQVIPYSPALLFYHASVSMATAPYDYR